MRSKLEFSKGQDLSIHENLYAAGIDVKNGEDFHCNRIEVYGKTKKNAQTLRNLLLAALGTVEIIE